MSNLSVLRKERHQLHEAAPLVAQHLHAAEDAADALITRLSELTATMIRSRNDANLSAIVGQDPLSSIGDAVQIAIRGRAAIVDAHHKLAATSVSLRLDPSMYGAGTQKPDPVGP